MRKMTPGRAWKQLAQLDTANPPRPKTVDVAVPKGAESYAESRLKEYKGAKLSDEDALFSLQKDLEKLKTSPPTSAEREMEKIMTPPSGGYKHNSPAKPL